MVSFAFGNKCGNVNGVAVNLCSCDGESIVAEQDDVAVGHASVAIAQSVDEWVVECCSLKRTIVRQLLVDRCRMEKAYLKIWDTSSGRLDIMIDLYLKHSLRTSDQSKLPSTTLDAWSLLDTCHPRVQASIPHKLPSESDTLLEQ